MSFSFEDKLKEVRREIALRKSVYPGLISKRKLRLEDAERQIEVMQAIHDDYQRAIDRKKESNA